MKIEYEATFTNINKNNVRGRLKGVGAKLLQSEFLQKRVAFHLPKENEIKGGWLRVRDEGDKITLSLKIIDGNKIEDQREVMLIVDDFESARILLRTLGCKEKTYQETKREIWSLDKVEVVIDEWPFLEPLTEIEGRSEEEVRVVAEKLGFDYNKVVFGPVTVLYSRKYDLPEEVINDKTPKIVFDMDNPFVG